MSRFTSATFGEIRIPVNIIKEFLDLFNRRQKIKAQILSWLDGKHWYGQEWVRTTYEFLADTLGCCRETISKHIRELIDCGLVDSRPAHRFPKDTAQEYALNLQKIEFFYRCEIFRTYMQTFSHIHANFLATYINCSKNFLKNNNVVEEKSISEEVDWDAVEQSVNIWEETQISNYVIVQHGAQEEKGQGAGGQRENPLSCSDAPLSLASSFPRPLPTAPHQSVSDTKKELGVDQTPQPQVEAITTSNQDSRPGKSDFEQSRTVNSAQEDKGLLEGEQGKEETPHPKPAPQEIKEVCSQLKRLRINPDPCLGVIKKYWKNVTGAIARVKEATDEGWCENPTGLFINSCKKGEGSKNTVNSDVSAWFNWARRERLVLAMSGGVVYTPDGEVVTIEEMMQRYPQQE